MNILYTTHCPKCEILKKQLDEANIDYIVIDNIDEILALEIDKIDNGNLPVFEHCNKRMGYNETIKWIKGSVK